MMSARVTARRIASTVAVTAALTGIAAPAFAVAIPDAPAASTVTAADSPCQSLYYKGHASSPREVQLACGDEVYHLKPRSDGTFIHQLWGNLGIDGGMTINSEIRIWVTDISAGQSFVLIRNPRIQTAGETRILPTLG